MLAVAAIAAVAAIDAVGAKLAVGARSVVGAGGCWWVVVSVSLYLCDLDIL